jgi:hypothetical protein
MPLTERQRADLSVLRSARVFFAHQSVGRDILEGLASLAREAGIDLRIDPPDTLGDGPGITQGIAGRNGQPDSKIQYFSDTLAGLENRLPQVALMKFCYVDFTPTTDSEQLFESYHRAITSLQRKYPSVSFVHVTVPLTTRSRGLKDSVKRLLGRSVRRDEANARRAVFNRRLHDAFKNEPIFDLARIESTRPDGSTECVTSRGGISTDALFSGYTSDGGHLNALGRQRAAAEFARVVAAAAR